MQPPSPLSPAPPIRVKTARFHSRAYCRFGKGFFFFSLVLLGGSASLISRNLSGPAMGCAGLHRPFCDGCVHQMQQTAALLGG